MAYNSFPIQVQDLALGSALQGQIDQNGLVATGADTTVPSAIVASLGQVGSKVELKIEETVSAGNTWTSILTSRVMTMGRLIASVPSFFFEVSATALKWTDSSGNKTSIFLDNTTSKLAFDSADVDVLAGSNSLIASTDSTHMSVGNTSQALQLQASSVGVSMSVPLHLTGTLTDYNTSAGTAGQILSSTSVGVRWITPSSGGGSVNTVDTKSATNMMVVSGAYLNLSSSLLPAGSYLVQYSVAINFAPVSGAGIQETLMESAVSDGFIDFIARSSDTTVRNISGSQTFYLQSSSVVVLASEGNTYGILHAAWTGGVGATVTATATMTSTLVNV